MFFGSSHLDQRYLGDDPTGSAAQDPNAPQAGTAQGAVPPGTLVPAPIITPAASSSFYERNKPYLAVIVGAVVAYYLLKTGKLKL
jgi:hypothetical protein